MCSVAMRVPTPKKTGDVTFDQQQLTRRTCVQQIIDRLMKDPAIVLPMHAYMMTGLGMSAASTGGADKHTWTGKYKFLHQIPVAWMCDFILKLAGKHDMQLVNKNLLSKLELDDSDNIPTLFSMILQVPLSTGFPRELEDPYTATLTFEARAEAVGNRLSKFVERGGISARGSLDFSKGGPFSLHFCENGICNRIDHINGASVTPPEHCQISRKFELSDNVLDGKATVMLHPRRDALYEFFPATTDFLIDMWIPGKKCAFLQVLAQKKREEVAAADKLRAEAKMSQAEVLQPAAKKRALEATQTARVNLLAAQSKRQKKRTIKLDP